MQYIYDKERLWKSVPAKKKLGSRGARAAFREVQDVKRKLDFHNDDETLRSEFLSKMTDLRGLISPRKSARFNSKSDSHASNRGRAVDVVCWSASVNEFDDLRHNDYFSGSNEDLVSRRDSGQTRRERNYCVVNYSSDPADFGVVRIDDGDDDDDDDGLRVVEETLQRNSQSKYRGNNSEADSMHVRHQEKLHHNNGFQNDVFKRPKSILLSQKISERDFVDEVDKKVLLHRLETRVREKRLKKQIADIKNTLQDRVLDDSSVSADSYSSHVSVDQAVKTLEILSDALRKSDSSVGYSGNRTGSLRVGCEVLKKSKQERTSDFSPEDPGNEFQRPRNTVRSSESKRLSSSLLSSSSSVRPVQTNVDLSRSDGLLNEDVRSNGHNQQDRVRDLPWERHSLRSSKYSDRVVVSKDVDSPVKQSRNTDRSTVNYLRKHDKEDFLSKSDGQRYRNGNHLTQDRRSSSLGHFKQQQSKECDGNSITDASNGCLSKRILRHENSQKVRGTGPDLEMSPDSDEGPLTLTELDTDSNSDWILERGTDSGHRSHLTHGRGVSGREMLEDEDVRRRESVPNHISQKRFSREHGHTGPIAREQKVGSSKVHSDKHSEGHAKSRHEEHSVSRTGNGMVLLSKSYKPACNRRKDERKTRNDLCVGDAETLTLADVQRFHREVEKRLNGCDDNVGVDAYVGVKEKDRKRNKPSQKNGAQKIVHGEKKTNIQGINKYSKKLPPGLPGTLRPNSPSKQKGVLIPGGISHVSTRVKPRDGRGNRLSNTKNSSHGQPVPDKASRNGVISSESNAVQVSADITIPDLLGVRITKTITRQKDGHRDLDVRDFPEKRKLNLSFEDSLDGGHSVQCEVQGYDLDLKSDIKGQRSQKADDIRDRSNNRYNQNSRNDENGIVGNESDKSGKGFMEPKVNDRPTSPCLLIQDRLGSSEHNRSNSVLVKGEANVTKSLGILSNELLKETFLSNCVNKLGRMNGNRIDDLELSRKNNDLRDDLGPASVFEPPERDTSTPIKKREPYQGNPLLTNNQTSFLQSNGSAADTIMAHIHNPDTLRLLTNLYQADDTSRKDLIILTQHFKTWQTNAKRQKEHRQNRDIFMNRAQKFLVNHLLVRYFYTWHSLAQDQRQNRVATDLFRHHMLKKGLDAFRWAISRSMHRQDMLSHRVNTIQLTAAFNKWRDRADTRRQTRLEMSFQTWRDFTLEAQRARMLRKSLEQKLMSAMLQKWVEMHALRVKQHKADYYRRCTMLSHMWLSWQHFTALSKQKRSRRQQAIALYREHLQRRMLEEMQQTYLKHQRACKHYRLRTLAQIFRGWHQSSQVCKVERQHDLSRSQDHWHSTNLRRFFVYWRETLWNLRAKRMDERNICLHMFSLWKEKWLTNLSRRRYIEKQIEMNKLRRSLQVWRDNVVQLRRRRAAAIYSLENALMRQMLGDWNRYTGLRGDMRMQPKWRIVSRVWKREFEKRVDEQTAKRFWSNHCARKASVTWQLMCRKRRLQTTLEETEPLRQLTLMQVMFLRWVEAKKKVDREKQEAAEMRGMLQRCQLRRRFNTWKGATRLALTIKPMVQSRHHKLVTQCFQGWQQLTAHKRQCCHSRDEFLRTCLQKALDRWRRQYKVHEIERQIKHRMKTGIALVCLEEWNFVIRRKHAAQQFHNAYLQRDMFTHWRDRTSRKLQQEAEARAEKERRENLKSYYFHLWWSNVQEQMVDTEDAIMMLHQRQAHNRIRRSFHWWRTHLQHTRSSRAYFQMLCERTLRTVLMEWHLTTDSSLTDAVHQFREDIGLPPLDPDLSEDRETGLGYMSEGSVASSSGFHSNKELSLWPDFDDNIDRGSESPRSTSSVGLPFRSVPLFSLGCCPGQAAREMVTGHSTGAAREMVTGHSTGGSLDRVWQAAVGDRSVHSGSLSGLEVFEERSLKRERLKDLVTTAVTRMRMWPVSSVFDQWLEFTARQRELKSLSSRLQQLHDHTTLVIFLHDWKTQHADMVKANTHCNNVLMRKSVRALAEYRQRRGDKKKLSDLAGRYNQLIVYKQYFPLWLAKTQDRQHQHNILHLWSNTTPEEQKLLPLERSLTRQFSRRTLRLCYAIWSLKFQFASKIKHAYHSGLLRRTLGGWQEWSKQRQERREKCDTFRQQRVTALVFRLWQQRLEQKRESDRRYTESWQRYLHTVLVTWKQWSSVTHQRRDTAMSVMTRANQSLLRQKLVYWRSLTVRTQVTRHNRNSHLTARVFCAWQEFIAHRKRTRQLILQFQVRCFTNQVKQLFGQWRRQYMSRLREKAEHQQLVQMQALQLARVWRKKAQTSRGRRLYAQLQEDKVKQYFSAWKTAYQLCLEREEVLERHLVARAKQKQREAFETWRMQRLADQAGRMYNMKLKVAVVQEWRAWTKGARERRIRGLALQKALQERVLTVYYKYWVELTRVRQMVQSHSHLKLQLRIVQAWHLYTQRQRTLVHLHSFLTNKVNHRLTQSAFLTMRCRMDYCQGLTDMAASLRDGRDQRLMRDALRTWQTRLDNKMAARCYGKFLVVRTVRKWRRFVRQRKEERRIEREKMEMAAKHYNKKLCRMALRGLHNELHVKHQQQRRQNRLVDKYARQWKRQTDLAYTARCVEEERLYSRMWNVWRVAFSRRRAADHIGTFDRRHLISRVFSAWRCLTVKKPSTQRLSSIPVATSMLLHSAPNDSGHMARSSLIPSLQSRQIYTNRK
ncbi:uncharacterized protein LOC124257486 [Haliotis rubra]|uniref:uncharacterized protein LOC124257486 n=1 Tax=Haliotis rubra TaxID=36100 RepID=UPI001EE564CD|nr:uncharacterized protein LOC124257486 [Haliotis rubra]